MAVNEAPHARTNDEFGGQRRSGAQRGPMSSVMKNAVTACDLARRSAERGKSGGKA